jgi:hypothetical protein
MESGRQHPMAGLPARGSLLTRHEGAVGIASAKSVCFGSAWDSPINHCWPRNAMMQS